MTDPTDPEAVTDAMDVTGEAGTADHVEESAVEDDALTGGDTQDDKEDADGNGDDSPAPPTAARGTPRASARGRSGKAGRTPADRAPAAASLPDVSHLSYEEARDKLVETVSRLESGQADLETSVALWEMGEALAAHCTTALDRAEARLDRTRADLD